MQLAEKLILRRYHALDNDWTPLSRNPCWLSNAAHHFHTYMKRNRFVWFHRLVTYRQKLLPTNYKLIDGFDKSFADDLVASRYCKHESSLCATICWDFSCVPTICSPFYCNQLAIPYLRGWIPLSGVRKKWPCLPYRGTCERGRDLYGSRPRSCFFMLHGRCKLEAITLYAR